jgi:MGT family glycosyltransferase
MARAVFLSLPLRGHVNPSLPLVRELVARGERVAYYSSAPFEPDVERTGAMYRPYSTATLAALEPLMVPATDRLPWLLMRTVESVLASDLDAIRSQSPDYVVTDSVAPWGQWIGEILGLPVVTSITSLAVNRKVMTYAFRQGVRPESTGQALTKLKHVGKAFVLQRDLRRRYRARGTGIAGTVLGRSRLNIVYTSRYFQPRAESFDARYRFVGPTMRSESAAFDWAGIRRQTVVYVALGTLFNENPEFYRACFAAFEGEDFDVILSTGTRVVPDALGAPPSNVVVLPQVPQLDVLGRGGMNSVSEGLYFGVPLVVVPQMGEQSVIGHRAAELGAALCLDKRQVTPELLRDSVRRVLGDSGYRNKASEVRSSFLEAGGAARAAEDILAFTRATRDLP